MEMPRSSDRGEGGRDPEFHERQAGDASFFTFIQPSLQGHCFGWYTTMQDRPFRTAPGTCILRVRITPDRDFLHLLESCDIDPYGNPPGFIMGKGMSAYLLMRSGRIFQGSRADRTATYALAATVVVVSAFLSGFVVRHPSIISIW